jgi:hypothetical protein
MIEARPYEDLAAMSVLQWLDPNDWIEAELTRGAPTTALALFADWRSMQPIRLASYVAVTAPNRGSTSFALFALANTGQAGVAQAALLARDHARYRRPLAELALTIRNALPEFCADRGIHRIEARAWVDHPTASRFLTALGFVAECDMPGFGRTGQVTFRQFAWLAPASTQPPTNPQEQTHVSH